MHDYAERAYFHGDHCQHVAAWAERARLARIWVAHQRARTRR